MYRLPACCDGIILRKMSDNEDNRRSKAVLLARFNDPIRAVQKGDSRKGYHFSRKKTIGFEEFFNRVRKRMLPGGAVTKGSPIIAMIGDD